MNLLLNNIKKKQISLIKKIHNHLKNVNYPDSSLNYYCSIDPTTGFGLLQYWDKGVKKLYLYFFLILKNFLNSFYDFNYIFRGKISNNYIHIIISWSKYQDFSKNGSYNDPYFNINSNFKKKCIWFLIHLDSKIPSKISKNIVLIRKNRKKINFIKLFYFIFNFNNLLFNFRKIIHEQSYEFINANKIFIIFKKLITNNVKNILIPYEGQPFQNLILKKSKEINKNLKTIGFVHNFPPPLPVNLIYRNGSPDKIIVSGADQKYFLHKYLLWNKNQIILSPSSRFVNLNKDMSNKIFLPGYINSVDFIIKKIEYLIYSKKYFFIANFLVQVHPLQSKSVVHISLKKKIESLFKKFLKISKITKEKKISKITKEKISIFFGPTGAIGEALETCHNVIHITDDPTFNLYTKILYPSIKVQFISKDVYKYSLNNFNQLINFGRKNITFNKYLNY